MAEAVDGISRWFARLAAWVFGKPVCWTLSHTGFYGPEVARWLWWPYGISLFVAGMTATTWPPGMVISAVITMLAVPMSRRVVVQGAFKFGDDGTPTAIARNYVFWMGLATMSFVFSLPDIVVGDIGDRAHVAMRLVGTIGWVAGLHPHRGTKVRDQIKAKVTAWRARLTPAGPAPGWAPA